MGRNKHPEETVNRILDASMKLFLQKGYEHTTIQDIVDELGDLSKGALYHHFQSKEQIVDAATKRLFQPTNYKQEVFENATLSGLEKIYRYYELSIAAPHQSTVFAALPSLLDNPKFLAAQIAAVVGNGPNLLLPLIEEGRKDGTVKTDFPRELAELLMLLFTVWLNPLVFSWDSEALASRAAFVGELLAFLGAPLLTSDLVSTLGELHRVSLRQKAATQNGGANP